jgi:hypothetical protein
MRRELPRHPHIDHLKKQAKELLESHRRHDAEGLARIVASLPAFAKLSEKDAAHAPFALHDAQSVVAREYGFPSWNDLRAEVERRASEAVPDSLLRALAGRPLPAEVTAALAEAWDARAPVAPPDTEREATLPLLAFRDAMLTPGAVAPIHLGRASSLAAVDAALASSPPLIAVFTQRDAAAAEPSFADLYPVGCVALVKKRLTPEPGTFIVVEGIWWASLESSEPAGGEALTAVRVRPFQAKDDLPDAERKSLFEALRARAHSLARAMPQPERVVALVDSIHAPGRLSDLVVANLPCPVADKARYAAETTLRDRLRAVIALCDAQLGAGSRP